MADGFSITPGVGVDLASDEVGGKQHQRVKLSLGADGTAVDWPGDSTNGGKVQIAACAVTLPISAASPVPISAASPIPVSASAPLPVSAPATAPLAVRFSNGATFPTTIPISAPSAIPISAASPIPVSASAPLPASQSGAWTVGLTGVGLSGDALKVEVSNPSSSSALAQYDETFTDPAENALVAPRVTIKKALHANLRRAADGVEIGTSGVPVRVDPTGTTTQPVSEATNLPGIKTATELLATAVATIASAVAGLKAVLFAGTDGTNARAIKTDASGVLAIQDNGGSLTVDGTVTANQGGAPWAMNVTQFGGSAIVAAAAGVPRVGVVAADGTAITQASPLAVRVAPSQTLWKKAATYSASETDIALRTPGGGLKFVVEGIIITPTAAGALLKIYDHTNGATTMIYQGQPPLGSIVIIPTRGIQSDTAGNILRYSTGASAAGDITVWGYDA